MAMSRGCMKYWMWQGQAFKGIQSTLSPLADVATKFLSQTCLTTDQWLYDGSRIDVRLASERGVV